MSSSFCVSAPMLFTFENGTECVLARWYFDAGDPLAVQLRFVGGPNWLLSRDALDPVQCPDPVEGADVQARWTDDELRLTVHGDDGASLTIVIAATDPDLAAFVTDVYDLVPAGSEAQRLDPIWPRLVSGDRC